MEAKAVLKQYLQRERNTLLWKLDGLGERDVRWPMTPTGTNLLGLVKHVASLEFGYFGDAFGRDGHERIPWLDEDAEDNADMWATGDQSTEWIVAFYRRAWEHSDVTIEALDLESPGVVPWWKPDRRNVTLLQIMVHMIDETARHAGHADIIRESIDDAIGHRSDSSNLPDRDERWWAGYIENLKKIAESAG